MPAWANPIERESPPPAKVRPLDILPPPSAPARVPARAPIPPPVKRRPQPKVSQPLIAQVVDTGPKLLIARPADALPQPTADLDNDPFGRNWLHYVIATLVSVLVNMLLIIILGMLEFQMPPRPEVLIVEVEVLPESAGKVGSEVKVEPKPKPEPAVKEPTPKAPVEPVAEKKPEVLAALPAPSPKVVTEKLVASLDIAPMAPSSSASGGGTGAVGTLLAGRDQAVRAKILNIEGGTERTEMAVAMGLKWLALHQNRNGSWSLNEFSSAGECRGQCQDRGTHSDTAGTALALLPFLGAGYTHKGNHDYRETVDDGLNWLIQAQRSDGDLRGSGSGNMYAHGQAAIALCEAYALTRDSRLKDPAQRAIDFIVKAQHSGGGWRYAPGERGDTSVVGWQLMALRSAQMAELNVPSRVFEKSDVFLASVQTKPSEGTFGYMPGSGRTDAMTAEGLLCRLYSGWRTNFPPLLHGADWLLKEKLPTENDFNMYYVYYATQTMHHIGGDRWTKWNERTKKVLVSLQAKEGHEAGSWAPLGHHDSAGGRLYMTALAVCTLEVYYRHLPIYKNDVTKKRK